MKNVFFSWRALSSHSLQELRKLLPNWEFGKNFGQKKLYAATFSCTDDIVLWFLRLFFSNFYPFAFYVPILLQYSVQIAVVLVIKDNIVKIVIVISKLLKVLTSSFNAELDLHLFALRHFNNGTYAIWNATDSYAVTRRHKRPYSSQSTTPYGRGSEVGNGINRSINR